MNRGSLPTLFLALALALPASAVPIQWTSASGGNDHWYEFVPSSGNWTDARAAALSMTHLGMSGYLANITSAAENAFVAALLPPDDYFWLGGTDEAVEGQWRWADGPEAGSLFGYTNWDTGEPNNFGVPDGEHHLEMYSVAGYEGRWNDIFNSSGVHAGFIVEYSSAVPEPGTVGLVLSGLLACWTQRRRLK